VGKQSLDLYLLSSLFCFS